MSGKNIKLCLVIGDPIAHSLSPVMHNAAYKALGIESKYLFEARRVTEAELGDMVKEVKTKGIHMLAVTIPHKETIMQYLDEIDDIAREIGAVNTVVNRDGKLMGYNTDCFGAIESLKKYTSLAGKKAVVLGSGGSSRAIIYGLIKEKCEVVLYGRNKDKVGELAKSFCCGIGAWDNRNSITADIIINTTPVGRADDELPISRESIKAGQIVFDINYNANGTPLVHAAKEKNAIAVDGLEMLLQQGMKQFELYTGLKAPETIMRKALQNKVNHANTI